MWAVYEQTVHILTGFEIKIKVEYYQVSVCLLGHRPIHMIKQTLQINV